MASHNTLVDARNHAYMKLLQHLNFLEREKATLIARVADLQRDSVALVTKADVWE
jgi:hypothetical protein